MKLLMNMVPKRQRLISQMLWKLKTKRAVENKQFNAIEGKYHVSPFDIMVLATGMISRCSILPFLGTKFFIHSSVLK